jgi:hypothetical protein
MRALEIGLRFKMLASASEIKTLFGGIAIAHLLLVYLFILGTDMLVFIIFLFVLEESDSSYVLG